VVAPDGGPAFATHLGDSLPVEQAISYAVCLAFQEVAATGFLSRATRDKLVLAQDAASAIVDGWHCLTGSGCIALSMYVTWMLTGSWELTRRAGACPSFPTEALDDKAIFSRVRKLRYPKGTY